MTKFHALRPPTISIRDYLDRCVPLAPRPPLRALAPWRFCFVIFFTTAPAPPCSINKYSGCSPEVFVLALVYIDRLISTNGLALTSLNVHRIVITAVMLAAKYFDDQYYNNAYYARVGGVPCNEVNTLELEMLFCCSFSLHVSTELFEKYFLELAGHCHSAPGKLPAVACDCPSFAAHLAYRPEEVRYTGLRGDLSEAAAAGVGAGGGGGGEGGGGGGGQGAAGPVAPRVSSIFTGMFPAAPVPAPAPAQDGAMVGEE